jgi:hypothetical protein
MNTTVTHAYTHWTGRTVGIARPIPGLKGMFGIVAATVLAPQAEQDDNMLRVEVSYLDGSWQIYTVRWTEIYHADFIGKAFRRKETVQWSEIYHDDFIGKTFRKD